MARARFVGSEFGTSATEATGRGEVTRCGRVGDLERSDFPRPRPKVETDGRVWVRKSGREVSRSGLQGG